MIITDEKQYKMAFKEVLVILNFIPKEDYDKIPKDIISILQKFQDNTYKYNLDFDKEFKEQNILDETKAILANFYRDYWSTIDEKRKIVDRENIERLRVEEEKRKKYNTDQIFRTNNARKNMNKSENSSNNIEKNLVVIEKDSIWKVLVKKIKKFLKSNKQVQEN